MRAAVTTKWGTSSVWQPMLAFYVTGITNLDFMIVVRVLGERFRFSATQKRKRCHSDEEFVSLYLGTLFCGYMSVERGFPVDFHVLFHRLMELECGNTK